MLIQQYGEYNPIDDMHINGELTLGENIADLGGLTIAYHAYQRSLDGREAEVIDGFTGEQRFFIGWAQAFQRKFRDDELRRRLVIDVHSPDMYRVMGVMTNMPQFYEAFGVQEGDQMYRSAEELVEIW